MGREAFRVFDNALLCKRCVVVQRERDGDDGICLLRLR